LSNLHGDVVATMDSGPGLVATADYDEFGVARMAAPGRYGWLGASQRAADTPSGVLLMGVRLYNPGTGRFLSRDPVDGGGRSDFDYCGGDPLGCSDESGEKWIDCSGSWNSKRFSDSWTHRFSRFMPYWKIRTIRHGKTINVRCKLSSNATKRLVEYGGPAAGAAIGAYLGTYCTVAAVFCSVAGAIAGAVVGAMSTTEYEIRCP
jgi:RHS repeat-associated protein